MIEYVDDPADPRLTPFGRVGDPQWLRQQGLFVAEGRMVLERLLHDGRFPLRSVLLTPPALAALTVILDRRPAGCPVYVASPERLRAITGFNFHRGCLAIAGREPEPDASTLLGGRLVVALERIGNPDNLGGIFRSAAAFAADGVLLDPLSCDPLYRKAVRTSMAATLRVPFARAREWPDVLDAFRETGHAVAALTPSSDALDIREWRPPAGGRHVLLLGSEGDGLSPGALAVADVRLRIPIEPATDSLNVAVAAGIALHWLTAGAT